MQLEREEHEPAKRRDELAGAREGARLQRRVDKEDQRDQTEDDARSMVVQAPVEQRRRPDDEPLVEFDDAGEQQPTAIAQRLLQQQHTAKHAQRARREQRVVLDEPAHQQMWVGHERIERGGSGWRVGHAPALCSCHAHCTPAPNATSPMMLFILNNS
jgi:hypothetical protein